MAARTRRAAGPLPIDTQADEAEALSPSDTSVAVADPATGHTPAATEVGRLAEAEAAIRVDIADDLGPGGLGNDASMSAGLSDRRMPRESFQISPRPSRFVRQNVGGLPDLNTTAAIPTPPYRRRTERTAGGPSEARSAAPSPQTEAAVELGLEFLARCQQARGNWTLQAFNEETTFVSDTAATALALLAFQGAGYTHREHRYASNVTAGLRFLIENQRQNGDLYLPMDEESNRSSWLYSHGIAALALCEAYGMTQDPALKEPAQRALDFVASSQDKTYGGWRYNPGSGADTSVTGWMMMALKSGELAGLEVPSGTYERTPLAGCSSTVRSSTPPVPIQSLRSQYLRSKTRPRRQRNDDCGRPADASVRWVAARSANHDPRSGIPPAEPAQSWHCKLSRARYLLLVLRDPSHVPHGGPILGAMESTPAPAAGRYPNQTGIARGQLGSATASAGPVGSPSRPPVRHRHESAVPGSLLPPPAALRKHRPLAGAPPATD